MTIVCAFDEGPGIGLGHRRRVESLAAALEAHHLEVELRRFGAGVVTGDVVVVDSYRVRADDSDRVRAGVVVAIDDIERDLAADLVVDPDPGADAAVHRRARAVAAGAEYAFVSRDVQGLEPPPVSGAVRRVLVATGGADAAGTGARLASALAAALPAARVRQVAGPWGRAADDPRVEVVHAPDGLGPELAAADLVATAGGVTMLESCCLGRPTVAFAIVPGQERSIAGIAALGAVRAVEAERANAAVTELAHDERERRRLSVAARSVIDGQGAARVAVIVAGMARHGVQSR